MHCFTIALESPSIFYWSKLLIALATIIQLTTNKYRGGGECFSLTTAPTFQQSFRRRSPLRGPPSPSFHWSSFSSRYAAMPSSCSFFARNAALRTPFTTYIINLLIANLLSQLFQQPLSIAAQLYTWPHLGQGLLPRLPVRLIRHPRDCLQLPLPHHAQPHLGRGQSDQLSTVSHKNPGTICVCSAVALRAHGDAAGSGDECHVLRDPAGRGLLRGTGTAAGLVHCASAVAVRDSVKLPDCGLSRDLLIARAASSTPQPPDPTESYQVISGEREIRPVGILCVMKYFRKFVWALLLVAWNGTKSQIWDNDRDSEQRAKTIAFSMGINYI